jgi:membrane protein
VDELRTFLDHRHVIGPVLLLTLVFFSALAFTVLENAMSVIFFHRVAVKRGRFFTSVLMPYVFILFLGIGFLMVTIVAGALQSLGTRSIEIFGEIHSLGTGLGGYGDCLSHLPDHLVRSCQGGISVLVNQ